MHSWTVQKQNALDGCHGTALGGKTLTPNSLPPIWPPLTYLEVKCRFTAEIVE